MKRLSVILFLALLLIQSAYVLTANAVPSGQTAAPDDSIQMSSTGAGAEVSPALIPSQPPKLRTNQPIKDKTDSSELQRLKSQPYTSSNSQPSAVEDLSANTSEPLPLAPDLDQSFEGLDDFAQPDGYFHRPPDPIIAVGPSHVVTMVNSEFAVYSKSGTLLYEQSFQNWWSTLYNLTLPFDPRIFYDSQDGRWVMVTLVYNSGTAESWYLLSVSQTSDPMGTWWRYKLNGKLNYAGQDTWADYPDIGFDGISASSGGAVYLTSNQFTMVGNSFRTSLLNVIPKSAFYSGAGFTYFQIYDRLNEDGSQAFTLRTAITYGNPGKEYLVNTKPGGWDKVTLWSVVPAFPSAPTVTRQATITIGSYAPPPNAKQLGSSTTLDTIDNRMYNAVYQNGNLYAAFTEAYDWGTSANNEAVIRYLKVDTIDNTADINLRYGADNYYYWFPAITVDNSDNIVMVFARSSATEYAGIRYTGQTTSDSALQSSALLKGGETYITGSRWGDYFGIQKDPADASKVWIYGQWAKNCTGVNSDWDWGTWIGKVSFAPVLYNITFLTDPSTVGSISFSSGTYTNSQTAQFTAGSYLVAGNAPSGYAFSGWETTGGVSILGSTATVTASGTIKAIFNQTQASGYLVIRESNNSISYRMYNSSTSSWETWRALPGSTSESPAAAVSSGRLYVVVRGMSGSSFWFGSVNLADNSFSGWTALDGQTTAAPTLVSNGTMLALVVKGYTSGSIWYRLYNIQTQVWGSWRMVPTGSTSDRIAAAMVGNTLHLAVKGASSNAQYKASINTVNYAFSGWTQLAGSSPSAPTLANLQNGTMYLAIRASDNRVSVNKWNGAVWEGWNTISTGATSNSPAACIAGDKLLIVVVGLSGPALWQNSMDLSTSTFAGWTSVTGTTPSKPTLAS